MFISYHLFYDQDALLFHPPSLLRSYRHPLGSQNSSHGPSPKGSRREPVRFVSPRASNGWASSLTRLTGFIFATNSDSGYGAPLPTEHRQPPPGSRPEKFSVPSSQASDVAFNPYWKRDFRRMYPKTEVVTQDELAQLLLNQGGFTAYVSAALFFWSMSTRTYEPSLNLSFPLPLRCDS